MTDITRAVAIRRGLRNLDARSNSADLGHAFELELARAYDAGHVAGSGVRHQTDAEQHLAEVVRELSDAEVNALGVRISLELCDAIEAVRPKGDVEETEAENFDIGADL